MFGTPRDATSRRRDKPTVTGRDTVQARPAEGLASRLAGAVSSARLRFRLRRSALFLGVSEARVASWARDYVGEVPWDLGPDLELYLLVRGSAPGRVVETGVNRGRSTTAILRALAHNGSGHLTSIDLPTNDPSGRVNSDGRADLAHVPPGLTGCEIPEYLRPRWTLILGDAREELPKLEGYDFFFHDSDHSYEHQRWEYWTATYNLTKGGILASDDINWSPAFGAMARWARSSFVWTPLHPLRGAVVVR